MAGWLGEAGPWRASDGGAAGSAYGWAVGPVNGLPRTSAGGTDLHPWWCQRPRCEFVNPPVLGLVLPRHRGAVERIGDRRPGSGSVMTWLMGRPHHPLLVGINVASAGRGSGGAELRMADVWRLARRLDVLLADAGFAPRMEG